MDHVPPRQREVIHHYYHEIGQKGGKHRGSFKDDTGYDPDVRPGFMKNASKEEQEIIHKWLHSVQTKKNFGEKEAEQELEEEFPGN